MWEYSAKEMKNDVFTGTWFELVFSYRGNICAANLVLSANPDANLISEEKAVEVAQISLCEYTNNDAFNVKDVIQTSISGSVIWKIYTDDYCVTVNAETGECMCISKMK